MRRRVSDRSLAACTMSDPLRISVAQLNFLVGDLAGNAGRILETVRFCHRAKSDLVVFSELALIAYPPEDLLLRKDFIEQSEAALARLALRLDEEAPGVGVIVGAPRREKGRLFNSAFYLADGKVLTHCDKVKLPNYSVFDEQRYFDAGSEACVISVGRLRLGVSICEDIWHPEGPAQWAKQAGADILINLNASPFHIGKSGQRDAVLRERAQETGLPIIYVNQVGGQDELVFDGDSRVVSADGDTLRSAPLFEEAVFHVDCPGGKIVRCDPASRKPVSDVESVWGALLTGLRDYVVKNGFAGVVIGLSGGVDSALTLVLAVESLGKDRVRAVSMPSRYTAAMSIEDARELAGNLDVVLHEVNIEPVFQAMQQQLSTVFVNGSSDVTEQNMQARIRGGLLMAIANEYRLAVITTSNKSETAVGYATLYGDMAGAFAPLKDLVKRRVYELARFCNRDRQIIPERIISRAPSAELAPGQLDQDHLPAYETLDAIVEQFVEADASYRDLVESGFSGAMVRQVQDLVIGSEHKRRQAPPGIKVTSRAFGRDRRYPITSGIRRGWRSQ